MIENNTFNFLFAESVEKRTVGRKEIKRNDGLAVISTVGVNDSPDPFETAICHPKYNDDAWVVVETYPTREDAMLGHEKWVYEMEQETLPPFLEDKSKWGLTSLLDDLDDSWRKKIKEP